MKEGRPALYDTPEQMIIAVENYFSELKETKEPATITGLALYLGFESRQSVYDYEKNGQFSYIIKNARLRVENSYEQRLVGNNPTGSIFALKNMGWRDKFETGFTNNDGEDRDVPVIYIPQNNRDTNEPADSTT